jgi:hypothetical protein
MPNPNRYKPTTHRSHTITHSGHEPPDSQAKKKKHKRVMPKHVLAMQFMYDPEEHPHVTSTFRCEYCKFQYIAEFMYPHLVDSDLNSGDTGHMVCRLCGPKRSNRWLVQSLKKEQERKMAKHTNPDGVGQSTTTALPEAANAPKSALEAKNPTFKYGKPADYTPPTPRTVKSGIKSSGNVDKVK